MISVALRVLCVFVVTLSFLVSAAAGQILVETEGFDDLGGWVVDQQFMDQMGSPFLLANGLGTPVADAKTSIEFPAKATSPVSAAGSC